MEKEKDEMKKIAYRSFEDARKFARKLKFSKREDWNKYCKSGKKPTDVPGNARQIYLNKGWISWGNFLGNNNVQNQQREYRSFTEARKFARKLKLKKKTDWEEFAKNEDMPIDIPMNARLVYQKKGWKGWGDWLGTGNLRPSERLKEFETFENAKKIVKKYNFQGQQDWRKFLRNNKLDKRVPRDPPSHYKDEWTDWGDWLGTGTIATKNLSEHYLPWKEAKIEYRKLAKKYDLKNMSDFNRFIRRKENRNKFPKNLPHAPWYYYSKENIWKRMK